MTRESFIWVKVLRKVRQWAMLLSGAFWGVCVGGAIQEMVQKPGRGSWLALERARRLGWVELSRKGWKIGSGADGLRRTLLVHCKDFDFYWVRWVAIGGFLNKVVTWADTFLTCSLWPICCKYTKWSRKTN